MKLKQLHKQTREEMKNGEKNFKKERREKERKINEIKKK